MHAELFRHNLIQENEMVRFFKMKFLSNDGEVVELQSFIQALTPSLCNKQTDDADVMMADAVTDASASADGKQSRAARNASSGAARE